MMDPAEALPAPDRVGTQRGRGKWTTARIRHANFDGVRLALGATLITRLTVWAAAIGTIAIFGENGAARHLLDPFGVTPPIHSGLLKALLSPAARWDSVWYLQIAAHGYFSPASANFFPLYPLLVGLGAHVSGDAILAGLAISLASTVAALTLLYRLALLDLGRPAAQMTVMLVAVFPASLFLSAVYPTSLLLLLTVAAVYAGRRERWALAGLCGGLAAATSSNGILTIFVLALMYLYGPRDRSPLRDRAGAWWRPRFPIEPQIAWLALVPAGLAIYLGYLTVAHGDPLAPYRAATNDWGHSFGPPLASIIKALSALPGDLRAVVARATTSIGPGDPISWQARNLIDVAFLGVAVAALVAAWSRVPRAYVLFAVVQLAEVTSFPTDTEPMIGLARYLLPMFALFMGAGAYLAERRTAARITLVTSAVLLALFSGLWAYWSLVP
ncbi:MAG TPA: mannosyltransferase family protein [Solirubrobacteraceae bacterium]|nr:mannosyltransferase family protein [Solirubrobacteraceae bacterium]